MNALLLFLATVSGAAPEPSDDGLPPVMLVQQALEAYPSVEAADARVQAAKGASRALKVGPHEVTVQGTISRRTVDREGDYHEFDGTISRAIRLPGKASFDRRAGQSGVDVAINKAEDARHQSALLLAQLWYDWLAATARHANTTATLSNLQDAAYVIHRRVSLRDASELDADQAESAVAAAELRVGEALAVRDRARAELEATFPELPLPADAPQIVVTDCLVTQLELLATQAVERSHDIIAAIREADRQGMMAERARLDRIPDPSVGFRAFRERSGQERGLGVYLSVPFGGGYRHALADQASSDASAAQSEVLAVRRAVVAHSAGDLAETRARLSAWTSSREAVARAEAAAAKTAKGQGAGIIDLTDRLYADRLAYEARAAEIDARVAAAHAVTKMRIDAHALWIE